MRHLIHVFPAFASGGPEVRTAGIINRTAAEFRHTVLSLNQDVSGRCKLEGGPNVCCQGVEDRSILGLSRLLRSLAPDLVLTYGWGGTDAIAAARLGGISRVVHTEDGFLDDEVLRQKPARQFARRVLFKGARCLVVPSKTLEDVAHRAWKVADKRIRYIPNGIDTDRFRPVELAQRHEIRNRLKLPVDVLIVGTVGGLRPEKNQLRLVRAFVELAAKSAEVHLLIVGDGPLRGPMQRLLDERGLSERATFVGSVSEPEQYYQAMDVFALPSDTEQMSLALLEAMATGLPVAGTDVGDTKAVVDPLNRSYIVSPNGDATFANVIHELLEDRGLRDSLWRANRNRCLAHFSVDQMMENYLALYREHSA